MSQGKIVSTVFLIGSSWLLIVGVVNHSENEKRLMIPAAITLAGAIVGFALSDRGSKQK